MKRRKANWVAIDIEDTRPGAIVNGVFVPQNSLWQLKQAFTGKDPAEDGPEVSIIRRERYIELYEVNCLAGIGATLPPDPEPFFHD